MSSQFLTGLMYQCFRKLQNRLVWRRRGKLRRDCLVRLLSQFIESFWFRWKDVSLLLICRCVFFCRPSPALWWLVFLCFWCSCVGFYVLGEVENSAPPRGTTKKRHVSSFRVSALCMLFLSFVLSLCGVLVSFTTAMLLTRMHSLDMASFRAPGCVWIRGCHFAARFQCMCIRHVVLH